MCACVCVCVCQGKGLSFTSGLTWCGTVTGEGWRGNPWGFPVAQMVKNMPAIQETWVWSLGWEDTLEKGMANHSSILAGRISWTEETVRLQTIELQRVGHDWVPFTSELTKSKCREMGKNDISLHSDQWTTVYSGSARFSTLLGWKKHKLESRLPGEISINSDMQMTPPLWQKVKRN